MIRKLLSIFRSCKTPEDTKIIETDDLSTKFELAMNTSSTSEIITKYKLSLAQPKSHVTLLRLYRKETHQQIVSRPDSRLVQSTYLPELPNTSVEIQKESHHEKN
jgi:hypothetical protein